MSNQNSASGSGRVTRRTMLKQSALGVAGLSVPGAAAAQSATAGEAKAPAAAKDYARDPVWLKAKYGPWGGPGVDARPGPMDAITARDYAPVDSLVLEEHLVAKARFPVIDVHAHIEARNPAEVAEWLRTMDEVGVETTILLSGATGERFDQLVELFGPHPDRFRLFCGVLGTNTDAPDYPQRAAAELERCYRKGARGVGELSDKGMGLVPGITPRNKRVHPDDPRLDLFFAKCAELKMPVNIHVADHPSCWKPLDVYQERPPQYQHFNLHGKDVPAYEELLAARDRMVAKHTKTTFIACHLGNQGNDLGTLGRVLDKFPNLNVDISARDYEVGRTPRAASRFLAKYANRVLFGTDMGRAKSMYQAWWRLFETADEFMPSRQWWRYYGLELPAPVLQALYRDNAKRLLNWS